MVSSLACPVSENRNRLPYAGNFFLPLSSLGRPYRAHQKACRCIVGDKETLFFLLVSRPLFYPVHFAACRSAARRGERGRRAGGSTAFLPSLRFLLAQTTRSKRQWNAVPPCTICRRLLPSSSCGPRPLLGRRLVSHPCRMSSLMREIQKKKKKQETRTTVAFCPPVVASLRRRCPKIITPMPPFRPLTFFALTHAPSLSVSIVQNRSFCRTC